MRRRRGFVLGFVLGALLVPLRACSSPAEPLPPSSCWVVDTLRFWDQGTEYLLILRGHRAGCL